MSSYNCWFNKPSPTQIVLSDRIHKEKTLNTYYISARTFGTAEYVVEAENEDIAISEVEMGNVDPETTELDYVEDIVVNDVEYGDKPFIASLTLSIVGRGVEEDEAKELLWTILATFDGKTEGYDDKQIELIGFNIDHIEED